MRPPEILWICRMTYQTPQSSEHAIAERRDTKAYRNRGAPAGKRRSSSRKNPDRCRPALVRQPPGARAGQFSLRRCTSVQVLLEFSVRNSVVPAAWSLAILLGGHQRARFEAKYELFLSFTTRILPFQFSRSRTMC